MPPLFCFSSTVYRCLVGCKFRLSAVTSFCEYSNKTSASLSRGKVSQEAEKVLVCQDGKLIGYLVMYLFI
jgi:hypothetical protein